MGINFFISKISVSEFKNINKFSIDLDENKRTHLILTGQNGSGKTTLLREMNVFLERMIGGHFITLKSYQESILRLKKQLKSEEILGLSSNRKNIEAEIERFELLIRGISQVHLHVKSLDMLQASAANGGFIAAYFDAKRATQLTVPTGINKVELKSKYNSNEKANKSFIQYIVNLKAERSFARDDDEMGEVERIDHWFENLERHLGYIFNDNSIRLEFDRKAYNFNIVSDNKNPYTLSELSDGQSAILHIMTELLLRMEAKSFGSYKTQGIAFIDEIETHLHVDLQKKILPFLVDFFPNIQFIVTTHSPFVLSSIDGPVPGRAGRPAGRLQPRQPQPYL